MSKNLHFKEAGKVKRLWDEKRSKLNSEGMRWGVFTLMVIVGMSYQKC